MNSKRKFSRLALFWVFVFFFNRGNPGPVLCSVCETNNPYDQGAVPMVKKLQIAPALAVGQRTRLCQLREPRGAADYQPREFLEMPLSRG